jgi:hypothetical protein
MGKSHSTTTYIIAAMVLGQNCFHLLRVTINKDGKEEKKREES